MVYIWYLLLTSPYWYWLYLGLNDNLGAEPIVKLNIETGYVTLVLILLNLWLGVVFRLVKKPWPPIRWLIRRRRSIGVASGLYAILHFVTYLGKESFEPQALEQIVTKTYLTVSFIALVILTVLLVTSNDFSVRKLKAKNWRNLHRFVHVAFVFIMAHVFLIEKANLILLGILILPIVPFQILRLWRWVRTWQTKPQ